MSKAWRLANPEKAREVNRKAGRKYALANPDKERARRDKFRDQNPDYWRNRREQGRAYEAAWRDRNPERRSSWRQRKVAKAGVFLTIRIDSEHCGICLGPLASARRHPDPFATTIGHEPPLAVAARDGWTVVTERPEHLRCNLWKNTRTDGELVGHAASSFLLASQSMIADTAA